MRVVTDSLVNGDWLTQAPTIKGQKVRQTTYFDDGTFGVVETVFNGEIPDMRITKRAFIHYRLSEDEYTRIDLASYGQTVSASKIRRFMDMFRNSPFFDLGLESNRADLLLMESLGLLDGVGRASEILDAPILDDERYEG